jgi:hypothetical protein
MARRDTSPDFIEALARGLDVIKAFGPRQRAQGRRHQGGRPARHL